MENNLQNKARFFAQYYGQKVWKCNHHDFVMDMDTTVLNHLELENEWLELKNLSDISDEDAIELGKVYSDSYNCSDKDNWEFGQKFIECYFNEDFEAIGGLSLRVIHAIDFLRRQSYLISFDGATVEEILEFGWARFKTD